ncbi:F-actin-capping protein subunit alpha [Tulasnella sp. 403]|nr:F-actin-capping protein subunit alpha [Tulasnella sp. 403]
MRLSSVRSSAKRSFRRFSRLGLLLAAVALYLVISPSTQSPPPLFPHENSSPPVMNHTWETRRDGKLVIPIDRDGNVHLPYDSRRPPRHPFHDLIEQAEQRWQSRSLKEAVVEYRRRYGREPPLGFDSWFRMAVEKNVILVDEFDQIDRDIAPFLAIPPTAVLDRMAKAKRQAETLHLTLADGVVTVEGPSKKAAGMSHFLDDIAPMLPNMTIHVTYSDGGPHVYGDDFRAEVNRVLAQGEYLSPENITHFESKKRNARKTVTKACFDDAPAVLLEGGVIERDPPNQSFRFIHDHLATMDYCANPDILDNHGRFINDMMSGDSFIVPLFVQSKLYQGGNTLYPSLVRFQDFSESKVTPWSERANPKLFWRGRMTGSHHDTKRPWRNSHRIRLHNLANNATLGDDDVGLLTEDPSGRLSCKTYRRKELNDAYLDTGLIGPVMQCTEDDGTCDEMKREINFLQPIWDRLERNKYVLDIDGNGWSARYQALLAAGSLVLKSTIFPEWNTNWLVPYYHYIPVQHDYSDLYNVMAFFIGSPEGHGGHEDLAEKIGMRAAEFVRHHWRWEDMQIYVRALATSPLKWRN